MQELESALAQQAPPQTQDDPTLHELPPLVIDGIPTPVEKMTQVHLRKFIPLMLKAATGKGKPGWGRESTRPAWWPKELPWANVKSDARTEEDKQKVSWTHALRQIVINCYKYHGREDLLPAFTNDDDKEKTKVVIQAQSSAIETLTGAQGTVLSRFANNIMLSASKIEESTLTDDSCIHIGNIIKEKMIHEEKVLEENSVEEGKMKECITKEEKDELVQQCHRNSNLSSSTNDCSSFFGNVITKEIIEEEKALEEEVIEEEIKIKEHIAQEVKDKLEESTLTDDSCIHIGNIIKEEVIHEEKVLEENSVEEGKMKECITKEEKDELVQQCPRNSNLSSSTNDCSFIGNVITKEMIEEEKALEEKVIEEERKIKERIAQEEKDKLEEHCYKRLNLLLSRSSIYAEFMADKIRRDREKEEKRQQRSEKAQKRKKDCKIVSRKKRSVLVPVHESNNDEDIEEENNCVIESKIETLSSKQPSLLTGAEMHPYQIKGFEWLKALYENGVNGILADEMGLGKTIQTIAFIAYLIEMGISGPFFVCGPLSTVPNWYSEFTRFTPNIPAIVYHGTKDERKLMRENFRKKVRKENVFCHPVVITSYQVALNDAKLLSHFNWKLLVVDEAHRIKNFQCKLVSALKLYNASNRLLLTGTPLQNDLSELWSLLNFILPEVFDDLKVFESWFDISRLTEKGGTDDIIAKEQEKQIVSIIHQILTPFLLRRTKTEVLLKLPPKKEVIVHAPLTKLQREYYTAALNKTIGDTIGDQRGKYFHVDVDINSSRPKRHLNTNFDKIYKQLNDDTFEMLPEPVKESILTSPESSATEVFSEIKLNIRNICMVLRKICGHPYLISYPLNLATGGHKIDEDFVKNSGKLLVLDSMLPELKKRGHKVLIFSQFVSMLEILEDYCIYRKFSYTILCGDMSLTARQKEIDFFNNSENSFIFLISTKAGGLGINLAEADTVIIYDSDWNPQGDIQAQDRCHRIGQTKPVVVYRLMVPNSVDERIIDRANAKRKLEKVIIKKGRFNSQNSERELKVSIEELLELLHSSDTDGFVKTDDNCVISPEELDRILDRSDMLASD